LVTNEKLIPLAARTPANAEVKTEEKAIANLLYLR
jgi:hypothetical protein